MRTLPTRTNEEELARICDYKGCEVSLSFEVRNKRWCNEHTDIGRGISSKERRRKDKELVKPKNYNPDLPKSVQLTETMTVLYEDYKEPLRTVSQVKGEGYGYMGTVAMSEDREYIQCHICGNLFRSLSAHVRLEHKISIVEYKKDYGLSASNVLIGESLRYDLQQRNFSNKRNKGQPDGLKEYIAKLKSGEVKAKRGDYSLEWRNKRGLCPDQVLEKILDLKEKLGRVPNSDEFRVEYKGRYMHSIQYLHGSWSEAIHKLGEKTREDLRRHSQEDLIGELLDFQKKYNRIPMTSDFNRGLLTNKGTFIRKFGTLNNARVAAGMNAVVGMGGRYGKYKEISPDEYAKYLKGHGISKDALRKRKERAAKKAMV